MWTVSPTRNLLVLPLALPNIDLSKWPSGPMFGDIPGWMVAWRIGIFYGCHQPLSGYGVVA